MNYLKMSDVLNLPVDPNKLEVYGYDSTTPLAEVERYVAHAVNVHDDLVTKYQGLLQDVEDIQNLLLHEPDAVIAANQTEDLVRLAIARTKI